MSDTYKRAKELFLKACDLDAADQAAFLDRECGNDPALRSEVESLLAHHRTPTASLVHSEAAQAQGRPPPRMFGPYRVVHEVGRGGMGVVYAAVRDDDLFKRRVAIKVLKRGMDTDEIVRRFDLERQVLAAMNHPGIARLYEGGVSSDGLPYFVMEYVEGQPIHEYCDTHRLRTTERLQLFRKVCEAVHYAHQNLVIHRDLKPSNILVTREGNPKLLDFGIAKLINPELAFGAADPTAPELRVMTPEYASPEQARGNPLTTASDIYALGVVLYELLTGHRPYRLRSRVKAEIARVICEVDPEKPSTAISRVEEIEPQEAGGAGTTTITPEQVCKVREGGLERLRRCLAGDIDNVVLMAMRKEPQRRYKSAEQLSEDIHRHLSGLPVIARNDTLGYRMAKFIRRNRAGVGAAATIAILLVSGIVLVSFARAAEAEQRGRAVEQRDRAERMSDRGLDLAHAFIFDFHDRIAPLNGTLKARELLATTAVQYLDGLAPDVGDDAALQRELASAYDKVGDIRGGIRNPNLGDVSGALENYRKGLELRTDLLDGSPGDREIESALAESYMHIGDMMAQSGDVGGALVEYGEALKVTEALANEDPGKYSATLDDRLRDMGAAMAKVGRLDEARQFYDRALKFSEQLANDDPRDLNRQRSLTVALIRVAFILETTGDLDGAIALHEKAIRIRQTLADGNRDSARFKRDLGIAHYYTARVQLKRQAVDRARYHAQLFMTLAQQGQRDNPDDARHKRDGAVARELIGMVQMREGDFQGAIESFRDFQSAITALSQADPADTQNRRRVGDSHERMGEVLTKLGSPGSAVQEYARALEVVTGLSTSDPADARLRADRARLLSALGQALLDDGRVPEARDRLESARALYEALAAEQPQDAEIREGMSETLLQLDALE